MVGWQARTSWEDDCWMQWWGWRSVPALAQGGRETCGPGTLVGAKRETGVNLDTKGIVHKGIVGHTNVQIGSGLRSGDAGNERKQANCGGEVRVMVTTSPMRTSTPSGPPRSVICGVWRRSIWPDFQNPIVWPTTHFAGSANPICAGSRRSSCGCASGCQSRITVGGTSTLPSYPRVKGSRATPT